MRKTIFILFVGILIAMTSCRSDFNFEQSTGNLAFSKDTVYLDTVFSKISSSTYMLKVYNKSSKDIAIPTVQLGKGTDSKYRMTVDGMRGVDNNGKIFKNVELLSKDSLFIFIETTVDVADADPTDFLYTDKILFGEGPNTQSVELVTLIQDAYFIYPNRENNIYDSVPIGLNEDNTVVLTKGRNLIDNHPLNGDEFTFKIDKPYVIYGYASVPDGKTLTIPAGARVHFHADSGLIVQDGATLDIQGDVSATGTQNKEVIFEGDRLEPFYSDVPGQWGFVYLRAGSKNNKINHLTLKNATVGLLIQQNTGTTTIDNTQIYDCSNIGIYALNTNITGTNIVVNSAGQAGLACTAGGSYNFTHCTFNNNWPSTKQVAVLINDYTTDANGDVASTFPLTANFNNSIIYGSNQIEMLLDKKGTDFNYKFNGSLIRFNNSGQFSGNPLYDFTNTSLYSECLISKNGSNNPKFYNVAKNKLNINDESAAYQTGSTSFTLPNDILGIPRVLSSDGKPDMGAYQSAPFPE